MAQEASAAYGELKRRYADAVAATVSGGGLLRDDGLANAEKHGLIRSEQLRRYTASRDRRLSLIHILKIFGFSSP